MIAHRRQTVYLGLGGNLGDPAKTMAEALEALGECRDLQVVQASSLYRTPPWGKTDQPHFLNAVAEIVTGSSPHELLEMCLAVEQRLKRERRERWGPRIIDIDILLYGNETLRDCDLQIPHPRVEERAFVLVPLRELAPDLAIKGTAIDLLLSKLDTTGIEKISADRNWWQRQE